MKSLSHTNSFVPALIIFAAFFIVGIFAGRAFAATVSGSSVNVYVKTAHGSNGAPGAPGKRGEDGRDGADGASSASVSVKTIINGEVVENFEETRTANPGEALTIKVENGKVTGTSSISRVKTNSPRIAATSRKTINESVAPSAPREILENVVSIEDEKPFPETFEVAHTFASPWVSVYSSIKAFLNHAASFFRF